MRKIIDYYSAFEMDSSDLDVAVKEFIHKGWQPIGGISVSRDNGGDEWFGQALVKYEDVEPKKMAGFLYKDVEEELRDFAEYKIKLINESKPHLPLSNNIELNLLLEIGKRRNLCESEKLELIKLLKSTLPSDQDMDWQAIVQNLKLDALAKQLARDCIIETWNIFHGVICLTLNPESKPLLTERQKERLREALSEYLGIDIKLFINLGVN